MTTCNNCGELNKEGAPFCTSCGRKIIPGGEKSSGLRAYIPTPLQDKIRTKQSATSGQRREVTILYLLIRFPSLPTGELEQETIFLLEAEIIRRFTTEVKRFEGHVDQRSGRDAVAVFGAPVMVENHAERAIQAALELQNSLQEILHRYSQQQRLQPEFSIGINTGPVLIGAMRERSQTTYTVIGSTLKTARMLAQRAEAGQILASATTWQLTHPLFQYAQTEDADDALVVAIYKLVKKRQAPGSLRGIDGAPARMVGRERTLAQLRLAMEAVLLRQQKQIVLISGEAGIGKSRLIREFKQEIAAKVAQAGMVQYEGYCLAHTRSQPYFLIARLVRQILAVDDKADHTAQQATIERFLQALDLNRAEVRPFLIYLLGLPPDPHFPELQLHTFNTEMLQNFLHHAVRRLLLKLAARQPLLLILEDLHWADSSSLGLLGDILGSKAELPILVLLTSRERLLPHFSTPSLPLLEFPLKLLGPVENRALVHQILAGRFLL